MKLLAVDPSITCSGWALFDVKSSTLMGVGKISPLSTEYTLSERLDDLHVKIEGVLSKLSLKNGDVMITESPTTMIDPSATIKVEQVRSAFETIARSYGADVPGRINPRSVQYEVLGLKGKQTDRKSVKHIARVMVGKLYTKQLLNLGLPIDDSELIKHQDIVDAILIGHLGLVRISSAKSTGESLDVYLESLQISRKKRFKASDIRQ